MRPFVWQIRAINGGGVILVADLFSSQAHFRQYKVCKKTKKISSKFTKQVCKAKQYLKISKGAQRCKHPKNTSSIQTRRPILNLATLKTRFMDLQIIFLPQHYTIVGVEYNPKHLRRGDGQGDCGFGHDVVVHGHG